MATWPEVELTIQEVITYLNVIVLGPESGDGSEFTKDDITKPSVSKAIADKFLLVQGLVQGRLAYETLAELNAVIPTIPAGQTTIAAEVVNDDVDADNGLYFWDSTSAAWQKSIYDSVDYANKLLDVFRALDSESRSGYLLAVTDDDGKLVAGVRKDGGIDNKWLTEQFQEVDDSISAVVSDTNTNLASAIAEVDSSIDSKVDTVNAAIDELSDHVDESFESTEGDRSGYAAVVTHDLGKLLAGLTPKGKLQLLAPDGSLELKDGILEGGYSRSGYIYTVTDKNGKIIIGFKPDGSIVNKGINDVIDGAVSEIGNSFEINDNTRSGYAFALTDLDGKLLLSVSDDGEFNAAKSSYEDSISALEERVTVNEEVIDGLGVSDIVCWGDSMTVGSGVTDNANRYPSLLAVKTGRTVWNAGVGGESANTIMSRAGAAPFLVSIHDNESVKEIPAAVQAVQIVFEDYMGGPIDPLLQFNHHSEGTAIPQERLDSVTLPSGRVNAGLAGELNGVHGWFYWTEDTDAYYFVRDEAGSAVDMSVYPYFFFQDYSYERRSDIQVIWSGQNASDGLDIKTQIQFMIDHQTGINKEFIIISHVFTTDEEDTAWEELWGHRVIKLRQYMSQPVYAADGVTIETSYGLRAAGLTPTAQDLIDIEARQVPESLRSDSIHFNDYGYQIVAELVYQRMLDLKYV